MVTKKLAVALADLFEMIRHKGILELDESECKSAVLSSLDCDEKLYFETVAAAFTSGSFGVDELQIINRNADLKCKTQNVLLSSFFDLLLLYRKNCSDKKTQQKLNKNLKKLTEIIPASKNVRKLLQLLANGDAAKCEEILTQSVSEHYIKPDWEVMEKLQQNS